MEEETLPNEPRAIGRWAERWRTKTQRNLHCAYEAGACGYALQRQLEKVGVRCDVVAPSLVPRKPGERIRTDRCDARKLAQYLAGGHLAPVRPPTLAEEAALDAERKAWTQAHRSWLAALRFEVGLVPSEASSGEKQRRGAITEAGNSHVRRLLIEAAWQARHKPGILANGTTGGAAYGSIATAGTGGNATYTYLVGQEGVVVNNTGVNPGEVFDRNHFAAAFVASIQGPGNADAGFVVNGFDAIPGVPTSFREGFLADEGNVSEAAFRSRATTLVGLDLAEGAQTWSSISMPNEMPIRVRNAAGSAELNVFYVSSGDNLVLGYETANVGIGSGAAFPTYKLQVGGTAAGTSWTNLSSRDYKRDIEIVDHARHLEMLDTLKDLDLTTYTFKSEVGGDDRRHLGFVAEDLPSDVRSKDGKGVDLYELLTYTIGAMKAQQDQIDRQASELRDLRTELEVVRAIAGREGG